MPGRATIHTLTLTAVTIAVLLLMLTSAPSGAQTPAPAKQRPLVGVIRWDGYNGSPVWTQQQEFGFLKPEQWWPRAPWFARRTDNPEHPLAFNPDYDKKVIQEVTNQEIRYAADTGIDYWAFCHYGKHKGGGWTLRDNFDAYLASPFKNRINFSIICLGVHIGAGVAPGDKPSPDVVKEDWRQYVEEYVELMRDTAYQRVCDGRPLFYLMNPDDLSARLGDKLGEVDGLREAVQYLRDQSVRAGAGDPYIAGMNAGGVWSAVYVDKAGLDAVSAYRPAFGATTEGPAYSGLWNAIKKNFIEGEIGLGSNPNRKLIVPLMSGANHMPRHDANPDMFGPEHYQDPLPGEFKAHILAGMDWTAAHPDSCPANTVLIYAWNEHSEGGFICPTMGEAPAYTPNTRLLDELTAAIREWKPRED